MTRPSDYQRPRHQLKVGERVRLAAAPDELLAGLSAADAQAVRAIVGKVLPVMGFNARGEVELEFRASDSIVHTIWVAPRYLKPLRR